MSKSAATEPDQPTHRPKRRRWTRLVMVVSLVLTVFLIGLIGGRIAAGPPIAGPLFEDLPQLARALPDGDRRMARRTFLGAALDIRRSYLSLRDAREDVLTTLTADPFDPQALDAAFAQLRGRTSDVQAVVHDAITQIGRNLSPEGRAAISEAATTLHQRQEGNRPDRPWQRWRQ